MTQKLTRTHKDSLTFTYPPKYQYLSDITIIPTYKFFGTIIDVDYCYHAFIHPCTGPTNGFQPLGTPPLLPSLFLLWDLDHFPHLDGYLARPLAPPLPPNLCKLLACLALTLFSFSSLATQTPPLGFHFAIARVSHCTKPSPWGRTKYA